MEQGSHIHETTTKESGGSVMPQVPKAMAAELGGQGQGLLSDTPASQKPDASSILMASSLMAGMGKLGRGGGESLRTPKKQRGTGKGMLK
jgi:hypothetical protein